MSEAAERLDKQDRRREILEAAFAEFAGKGYAGASMEAIARRARASKETLYAWFQNKETLFNTLVAQRLTAMTRRSELAAGEDASPAHLLPIIAEDTIRLMLAISPLSQATGLGEASAKARHLVGETIRAERARFVDYLLRCRAAGQIAFEDDPFELASLFVAMAEGEWQLRLDTGITPELTDAMIAEHAQRVTRMFLGALAPAS
ncbi:MAG TPA: helix-turn-helix domain-containing protein [Caulobacteraceae bacterium]|nr:helix-turn-helix domain-containing protein [Caulobacteraceae bacterium]